MSEATTDTTETIEPIVITCPSCNVQVDVPVKATRVVTQELAIEGPAECTIHRGTHVAP